MSKLLKCYFLLKKIKIKLITVNMKRQTDLASKTTPTPNGCIALVNATAICFVNRSCTKLIILINDLNEVCYREGLTHMMGPTEQNELSF